MELPDLSQKEIEHIVKTEIMPSIKKMDREQLNNLYYLALKKIEEITKDYNELLDELNRIKKRNTNDSDSNDDHDHVFTPRRYTGNTGKSKTTKGIVKRKTSNWPYIVNTPPNTFFQHLDKTPYHEDVRPVTPPRKKTTTRKGGKNNRKNKTMRKYIK